MILLYTSSVYNKREYSKQSMSAHYILCKEEKKSLYPAFGNKLVWIKHNNLWAMVW